MFKTDGFVSIMALLIMSIILIFSLFLLYISNMEYLILNSSKNNTQAYYWAESKIYMILYMEEYYNLLLSRIEKFFKTGRLADGENEIIRIEEKHLLEGDNNGLVNLNFGEEAGRRILELSTKSSCNGIENHIVSKIYIVNDFFEMGIPVISETNIAQDKIEEYKSYMQNLHEKIMVPFDDEDIIGVDGVNYEKINIKARQNNIKDIEYFRNNIDTPIKTETIERKNRNKKIFLSIKNEDLKPREVYVLGEEGVDNIKLRGIFYIEGNFHIYNKTEINGILIINGGHVIVEPSARLDCNGLILLKDYMGQGLEYDNIGAKYDKGEIKICGIYLPGFIRPLIKLIKRK